MGASASTLDATGITNAASGSTEALKQPDSQSSKVSIAISAAMQEKEIDDEAIVEAFSTLVQVRVLACLPVRPLRAQAGRRRPQPSSSPPPPPRDP